MAERSWYIASDGKQEGPFPETDIRAFIAAGRVTAETLVWSEGMTAWQRAGDFPDLFTAATPPPMTSPPAPLPGSTQWVAANPSGTSFTADFSVFGLFGRVLLVAIGVLLIIPAPWVMTAFYRWIVPRVRVSQIPALGFTGKVGDIWWVFILIALCTYAGLPEAHAAPKEHVHALPILLPPVQAILSWLALRWIIANISSAGRPLALQFNGSVLGYIGWTLLLYISFVTIIGWAWVTTAMMRWIASNIGGTPGLVVFNASGWQVLWRTFALSLGCIFIIPIPWLLHWYARWYVSRLAIGLGAA